MHEAKPNCRIEFFKGTYLPLYKRKKRLPLNIAIIPVAEREAAGPTGHNIVENVMNKVTTCESIEQDNLQKNISLLSVSV